MQHAMQCCRPSSEQAPHLTTVSQGRSVRSQNMYHGPLHMNTITRTGWLFALDVRTYVTHIEIKAYRQAQRLHERTPWWEVLPVPAEILAQEGTCIAYVNVVVLVAMRVRMRGLLQYGH